MVSTKIYSILILMGIFKRLFIFLKHNYWIILLVVVGISYGQTILMLPWQDDNAIFFKLAHIREPAGFLGKGIFGEGSYKYTAFFYYPIYLLFKYKTAYYFLLSFLVYFLSVLVIYKVVSKIINEKCGKLSSFLYACGYIASDGFIRLFNSVITSLSVILTSSLLYFYWNYHKKKRILFYLLTVGSYFLAIELARARTHYLIAPVILFEILFLASQKKIKYFYQSALRLLPFLFIFYKYFIQNGDRRSQEVLVFIKALIKGDFSILYGYLSSLSNIFVPGWVTKYQHFFVLSLILIVLVYLLFRRSKRGYLVLVNIPLAFIWYFISEEIYSTPLLNPNLHQLGLVYLGGVFFALLITVSFYIRKEIKIYYLLFCTWILINLASYSAYSPTVIFDSINRYLAHSFFALTILLGILYKNFEGKNFSRVTFLVFVFLYGLGNLSAGLIYQNYLLKYRTAPVKQFYQKLVKDLPKIEKGDILYFDVADDARVYFADAFSVAQMPETTAIAWRYGIDRYDFFLAENYDDFVGKVVENKIATKNVYPFFYSKEKGLVSTKEEFEKLSRGVTETEMVSGKDLSEPYHFRNTYSSCVIRPEITLTLSARPDLKAGEILNNRQFPFAVTRAYAKAKRDFYNSVKVLVSSNWRERVNRNLIDQNTDTAWQADRVTWDEEKTYFGFDLGKVVKSDRFVWVNAFANNTPTRYSVEVSLDDRNWNKVAEIEKILRIDGGKMEEVRFPAVSARFIRMVISKTLNEDSAGISEAWIVPAGFEEYSIKELEDYLQSPQNALINNTSSVSVLWKSDSSVNWQKDTIASFKLLTDGLERSYRIPLPCKGTKLEEIKLEGLQFPIILNAESIGISHKTNEKF